MPAQKASRHNREELRKVRRPALPKKQDIHPPIAPITTGSEWEKRIRAEFNQCRKILRRQREKRDGISSFDFTDAMIKRRQRAILNTISEIYRRYEAPDNIQPILGDAWIELNIPFMTYSQLDAHSHILFAASVWILDQITAQDGWYQQLDQHLPHNDEILDELCRHDVWLADYDDDLVYSVEYVLHNRNDVETDGQDYDRTVTSDLLASGRVAPDDPDRKNYDALIRMIPQAAIDRAVKRFRDCFWKWVDRYYEHAAPLIQAESDFEREIRRKNTAYNKTVDELSDLIERAEKVRKDKKTAPFARNHTPINLSELTKYATGQESLFDAPVHGLSALRVPKSERERAMEEAFDLADQLSRIGESLDEAIEKINEVHYALRGYGMRMARIGRVMKNSPSEYADVRVEPMDPMQFDDPYELCFALLYLTEADDDLPWLYGAACGLMGEVVEALPWGIMEYDETSDDVWYPSDDTEMKTSLPKSIVIPNWYERHYRTKDADIDFPRNLAQIVYEETGCIPPRDLHMYDSKAKLLNKYGIRGKDAASLLVLMSTMASARRSVTADNLDSDLDSLLNADTLQAHLHGETKPADAAEIDALKAEIKRLKSALHAAEQENRESKKTIAGMRGQSEREHRELADLRDYVFNLESVESANDAEESPVSGTWPYAVQRETVVFGGHATWLKGIKSLLTGNIRFIDKTAFDLEIVKHADVIWFQPNALSHSLYWRVIDTARSYRKSVRYFSFASWGKCAEQVVTGDRR